MIRNAQNMMNFLSFSTNGCEHIIIPDREYASTTKKYLYELARWVNKECPEYGPKWDCDNFAHAFKHYADIAHARSSYKGSEALAIGVVFCNKLEHAFNIAMLRDGKFIFFDPQGKGKELKLNEEELDSISYVYM